MGWGWEEGLVARREDSMAGWVWVRMARYGEEKGENVRER